MSNINSREKGAVSIFIVIIASVLLAVLTISFVRLMLRDQQAATQQDLSQSAFDSANIGIEDAKRALRAYYQGEADSALLNGENCDAVRAIFGRALNGRTNIQSGGNSYGDMNQAYHCVTIQLDTDDYLGSAAADEAVVVPLSGVSAFNRVKVEWFSQEDLSEGDSEFNIPGSGSTLHRDWPDSRPPVMEAQLAEVPGGSFRATDFDRDDFGSGAQAWMATLYPSSSSISSLNPVRSTSSPDRIACATSTSAANYACSVELRLGESISGSGYAYLRLTPRYNSTNFRVSLLNGSTMVQLEGVQPEIDSTGSANDLFRRVVARVEPGSLPIYPEAALDVSGNFCKTFSITDTRGDFDRGNCTP